MIPLGIIGKLKTPPQKNFALASNGGTIYSNIAPDYGSLSNVLLGNRQVTEASGNWVYWDLSTSSENLEIQIGLDGVKNIDKIVFAWGNSIDGTIIGSNTIDTTGGYFPKNSGELISIKSYYGGYTDVPFTTPTSRLQEYSFTQIGASSVTVVISKDMAEPLYLCGIEVWGS